MNDEATLSYFYTKPYHTFVPSRYLLFTSKITLHYFKMVNAKGGRKNFQVLKYVGTVQVESDDFFFASYGQKGSIIYMTGFWFFFCL